MLPSNVKKTFSHAVMSAAATVIELICLLIFCFPFAFVIGVIVSQFIS